MNRKNIIPTTLIFLFFILFLTGATVKPTAIKKEVSITNLKKGIGMPYSEFKEDFEKSGASWYYNWGRCPSDDQACIPMTWGGEDPSLPLDYDGYLLFLNEPDRPDQANKTPEEALILYKYFTSKYPDAKMIVGNIFGIQWNLNFKSLCLADPQCILPTRWGFHSYYMDMSGVNRIKEIYNQYHPIIGGSWWVTEFANIHGEIYSDNEMLKYFNDTPWIERYAIFCNRAEGNEIWFPKFWHDFQLFDWGTGEITAVGRWYAYGFENIYLPFINRY